MKKIIYKYPVAVDGIDFKIKGLQKVLCVKMHNDLPTVWCELDLDSDEEKIMTVNIIPTGFPDFTNDAVGEYLDTVIMPSKLVWHIYIDVNEY